MHLAASLLFVLDLYPKLSDDTMKSGEVFGIGAIFKCAYDGDARPKGWLIID
jgi:hypothetical protein